MASGVVRVAVLGAGHAGLAVARELTRRGGKRVEVSIVSRDTAMLWHGLMPQVISNLIQPQDALVSLRRVLPGVTIYPYEIRGVDLDARRVILIRGAERDDLVLDYDYLVMALGSATDLSSHPGLAEHGLQALTFGDAFHLRNHVLDMLELAEIEDDPEERRRMLTFVVAGAGFAGVEICAEINDLVKDSLRFYPKLADAGAKVVLLSASPRILRSIDERLAERAHRKLTRWGIDVRLEVGVQSATATAAILSDGTQLPTRTLVVTTGVSTHPLVTEIGLPMEEGRLACEDTGRVRGHPGVYAAGDDAAIPDSRSGKPLPATATAAKASGQMVARNILAELDARPLERARTVSFQAAALGRHYGVVQAGGLRFDGFPAAFVWRVLSLSAIPSWYRRTTLLFDWMLTSAFPRDVTQLRIARTNAVLPMRFGAGEVIIRQGEPGTRFYVITGGEAEVLRRASDGTDRVVATLGPGRYFGEIALLRGGRRTATVRALTDLTVVSLDRKDFGTLVRVLPHLLDTAEQAPVHAAPIPTPVALPAQPAVSEPRTEIRRLTPEESEQLRQRK